MPAAGTRARGQGLKKYQALTNISVPMPGENKENRTFLAVRGETIELTPEQARNLQRNHPRPVIRPVAEGKEPLPALRGMDLSGRLRVPPANPGPGYDGPRQDPPGSSRLLVQEVAGGPPELTDPHTEEAAQPQDALDIAPGTPRNIAGGLTYPGSGPVPTDL